MQKENEPKCLFKKSKKQKQIIIASLILIIIIIVFIYFGQKWIADLNKQINILSNRIYHIEQKQTNDIYAHFSLDDTIGIFKDLYKNENKYDSIFENATLQYLLELHNIYGIKVSCYCWYEDEEFNLSLVSNQYAKEFQQNSDWLRFGFHAYDSATKYETDTDAEKILEDYNRTINELVRITGGESNIDNVVRLHYYAGTKKCIDNIKNTANGITGLLTADTEGRDSYYLSQTDSEYLYNNDKYEFDDLLFINTDFRMENFENIEENLELYAEQNQNKTQILEFFTHEWILKENYIKDNIEACCKYAIINNYSWHFPEDKL